MYLGTIKYLYEDICSFIYTDVHLSIPDKTTLGLVLQIPDFYNQYVKDYVLELM